MYLARLTIEGFRRLAKIELRFREGLNGKHPVNPSCQLGGAGRPAMREQFGDVGRLVGR
ncbi:hypothetical protein ACUXIW_003860, partial [Ralstonia pickettii]